MKKYITLILSILLILIIPASYSYAKEPLIIVTEPWPPYIFEEGSSSKGMDYEITESVFRNLNIPVKIQFYPWKRCIMIMQKKEADAILDAIVTNERKEFLFFPEEPISGGPTILFYKKGKTFTFNTLADLKGYKVGTQLGYDYGVEINNAPFIKEEVPSLESNFNKLLLGRIDFVIANKIVALYQVKEMGIADKIEYNPKPLSTIENNNIGFAKKQGYETLANDFSNALKEFKKTQEYKDILAKYGQ